MYLLHDLSRAAPLIREDPQQQDIPAHEPAAWDTLLPGACIGVEFEIKNLEISSLQAIVWDAASEQSEPQAREQAAFQAVAGSLNSQESIF